jgi:hypothetical protein
MSRTHARILKETRVKQSKQLTFTQLLMNVANDNELEQEYAERETVTASRIREVLRDSYQERTATTRALI